MHRKRKDSPKKGTERPTSSVETTRTVLMPMEYKLNLEWFDGISSSRHIATGDRLKAYVVLVKKKHLYSPFKG